MHDERPIIVEKEYYHKHVVAVKNSFVFFSMRERERENLEGSHEEVDEESEKKHTNN